MVGNLPLAGEVLRTRELIREDSRQKILRVATLKLRRCLLAVAETPHGQRDRRSPAPASGEHRGRKYRLRQDIAHRLAGEIMHHFVQWKAMDYPERQDQRIIQGGGLELEVKAPAEAFPERQAPGAIEPGAERRVNHQMRVACLIEEAFKDDVPSRGQPA